MVFFIKTKNKKQNTKSIYDFQHTKFSIKKIFKRSKFTIFFLLLTSTCLVLFFVFKTIDNKLKAYFNPDSLELTESDPDSDSDSKIEEKNISFVFKDNSPLSQSEKNFIIKKLSPIKSTSDIKQLALETKVKLSLKSIHILKTASDSFIVSTEKLVPVLSINLKKSKSYFYITEDAHIYNCSFKYDLPSVLDVPIGSSTIEDDGYVFLTQEEFQLVSNIVKLYKELNNHNIDIDQIKYIKHRGLSFKIKDTLTSVIVGTNLFDEKLKKLEKILKNNYSSETLVELDYNNKAFITEKSL